MKLNRKKLHKNIFNGNIVNEYDESYSQRELNSNFFKKEFIDKLNLNVIDKIENNSCTLFYCNYGENKLNVLYQYLRNSGSEDNINKRMQYYKRNINDFNIENNCWFASLYNTGDKIILVLMEDLELFNHLKKLENTSSLWINFKYILECYENGYSFYKNAVGRKIYLFDLKYLSNIKFVEFFHTIFTKKKNKSILFVDEDNYTLFDDTIHTTEEDSKQIVVRNDNLRKISIKRANFTCENCGSNQTFFDKNNEMFFESHHLIPYNIKVQSKFKYLLDNIENLCCLCPNCHRKIHLANLDDQILIISKLSKKRDSWLKKLNILNINDIINLYNYE